MSDTVTWLAGVRCAVMLTFDFDAESQWKQMRLVRTLVGRQREARLVNFEPREGVAVPLQQKLAQLRLVAELGRVTQH